MASFTPEEWKKMGKDMEGTARFTEEYGGGYMGFLEVNHQMHVGFDFSGTIITSQR